MKRIYYFLYILIVIVNIIPIIPLSIKGVLGLIFIIINCIKYGLRDGVITATLLILLGFINFFLGINVDYEQGMITMLLGSTAYYIIALVCGQFVESGRNKTKELKEEIERRKNVERELKEKITMLQSLLDTMPSPIYFKDINCRFIGCNRAYEVAMGVNEADIAGKTIYDITDTRLAEIYEKKDKELLDNLSNQSYEEGVLFANESLRNVIFNKAIFRNENGEPIGIVGVMTDITDKIEAGKLKQSIVEREQEIDKMLENDKIKTEFFSNISHELRTPLNVILGSVQLMELYLRSNYDDSRDKVARNIAVMKQNCYRLLRLVNNIIDVSKIDAKAFEIHLKNCNIVSIIEEITLSVSDYTESKGIKLVFDTDIEEKVMACDEEKIERILLNLLSNAAKFTPQNGKILVRVHDRDNGLCIKVADNGIGIPEDKKGMIFQRFCQIDEVLTRQHEGSGIGLSLVKSLVEMHGGTITFESRVGHGTCFIINLPDIKIEEEDTQYSTLVKQAHIEKINIEFSDIYSLGN